MSEPRAALCGGRSWWGAAPAVMGLLAAIYLVPLHVPMKAGFSEAYMLGFNTRAASVVICCGLVAFAVWSRGLGLALPEAPNKDQKSSSALWATLLLSSVAMVGVWWVLRRIGPANEGLYFADRYQMFHSGARPYRDFEFAYGPLMFYLPVWIRTITRLSFTDSYYSACLLEWVAGLVVLWNAVRLAGGGRWVYLLLWGFFATSVCDGAPLYGPLRFASGVLLALTVHRLLVRHASALAGFTVAAIGVVLLLSYSPEQGIAFGVATVLYFVVNHRTIAEKRDWLAGAGLFVVAVVVALIVANRMGVLDTLKSYADGGAALPLVASPESIVVLLLMLVAVCAAWGTLRQVVREHPLLYVLLVSVCAVPAAFSRCFGAAMVGQMLGAMLVGLTVLKRYKWPWRVAACGVLVLIVGAARDQVKLGRPLLRAALSATGVSRESGASGEGLRMLAPFGWDQKSFERSGKIQVLSGRYAYYQPQLNSQVPAEKIAELEANASLRLLLPREIASACEQEDAARRMRLKAMLHAIYLPPTVHAVTAGLPLCDYIGANYRQSALASPDSDYLVWVRSH